MSIESLLIGTAASAMIELFKKKDQESSNEKKTYAEKLEKANGDDIFKYVLLINISALEGYVAQTRIQAQQSFQLSKIISIVGFFILIISIILSIYLTTTGKTNLDAAYLGGIAGVMIEFIAGIFFYLYNKTLQQINLFHDKLVAMQQTSMSYMATSLIKDDGKKDQARIDLSNKILTHTETAANN